MFMFPCLLLLAMFMFACTFAFALAGLTAGLGDAVTIVFELLFEFSVVLQAAPKTANANKVKNNIACRISFPPMCNSFQMRWGPIISLASGGSSIECTHQLAASIA